MNAFVPQYMTVDEVASALGCTASNVYALCSKGKLGHLRLPGLVRISGDDLEAFYEANPLRPRDTTSVYLAYGADDTLLYVGITGRDITRLHSHSKASKWWSLASRIELEHYPARALAELREAGLIATRRPVWNVAGKPRDSRDSVGAPEVVG